MKEGVTTTMKRKRGKGLAAPLHGLLPPSPIYMLDMLLFYTHLVVFHPQPCCSTPWLLLKWSTAEIVSHQHLEKWRRRRSSGGSLLPLPRWTEGMEDVTELYVWPSTKAPPVVTPCARSWDRQVNEYVDYVKWTTTSTMCIFVESSSTTFVWERNPRFRSSRVS
jgi:hypothetical protein